MLMSECKPFLPVPGLDNTVPAALDDLPQNISNISVIINN